MFALSSEEVGWSKLGYAKGGMSTEERALLIGMRCDAGVSLLSAALHMLTTRWMNGCFRVGAGKSINYDV